MSRPVQVPVPDMFAGVLEYMTPFNTCCAGGEMKDSNFEGQVNWTGMERKDFDQEQRIKAIEDQMWKLKEQEEAQQRIRALEEQVQSLKGQREKAQQIEEALKLKEEKEAQQRIQALEQQVEFLEGQQETLGKELALNDQKRRSTFAAVSASVCDISAKLDKAESSWQPWVEINAAKDQLGIMQEMVSTEEDD